MDLKTVYARTILFFVLLLAMMLVTMLQAPSSFAAEEIVYRTGSNVPVYHRGTNIPVTMASSYNRKVQEFRAVWVATVRNIDMPQQQSAANSEINRYKDSYTVLLDMMEKIGMNTIIFQVRPTNDAFYPSKYNYWSPYLITTGTDPGWDPLGWMIAETHARGMEFHAWINPYRVAMPSAELKTSGLKDFAATQHPRNAAANPDNLLKWYLSSTMSGIVLNPGVPEVREFMAAVVEEIIVNYDVDAIHMDDYFYYRFDADSGGENDNRFDDADFATFMRYRGSFPVTNEGIADWRREQTALLVETISDTIYRYNLEKGQAVQFGISPTGVWRNGDGSLARGSNTAAGLEHYQSHFYADSKRWIESGWLDYIIPQSYWGFENPAAPYADVVDWWVKVIDRPGITANLYTGHGIYRALPGGSTDWMGKTHEVKNQLKFNSKYGVIQGGSFFSYSTFKHQTNQVVLNGINTLQDFWGEKVPGPPLKRYPQLVVAAPQACTAQNESTGVRLNWQENAGARGYLIFRTAKNRAIDVNNSDHLLRYVTNKGSYFDAGASIEQYDYYLAAVSRANHMSDYVRALNGDDSGDDNSERRYGDLNSDGLINIHDVVLLMRHVMEIELLAPSMVEYGDVNGDGRLNVLDVTLLMQKSLDLIDRFPRL